MAPTACFNTEKDASKARQSHRKARRVSSDMGSSVGRMPFQTAQVRVPKRADSYLPRVRAARSMGRTQRSKAAAD